MTRYKFSFPLLVMKVNLVNSPRSRPCKPRGRVGVYLSSFCNLGAKRGWLVNPTARPLDPRKMDPVRVEHETGEGGTQVRSERVRKILPERIRSQDRPSRSKSLYQLSFSDPTPSPLLVVDSLLLTILTELSRLLNYMNCAVLICYN